LHHLIFSESEKLIRMNYSLWSHKILTISKFRDFDQIILDKEQRPTNNPEDYDKRHKNYLLLLKLSVTDTLVLEVENATITSCTMDKSQKQVSNIRSRVGIIFEKYFVYH
jgi:hypothetical protein